ncbi:MAG: PepSY domain-containing protein, partial [Paracoccaceae bacterium]
IFLLMVGVTVLFFLIERLGAQIDPPEPAAAAERADRVAQDFSGADLDRLVGLAAGLHPDLVVTTVGFPGNASQPFSVNGYLAEKGRYFGAVTIAVDPSNGAILGDSSTAEVGGFARVYPLILALHYGNWGGFAGLLLYALFSAAGLALLISAARISVERHRYDTAAPISWPRAYLRQLGLARWAYALGSLGLIFLILRHLT